MGKKRTRIYNPDAISSASQFNSSINTDLDALKEEAELLNNIESSIGEIAPVDPSYSNPTTSLFKKDETEDSKELWKELDILRDTLNNEAEMSQKLLQLDNELKHAPSSPIEATVKQNVKGSPLENEINNIYAEHKALKEKEVNFGTIWKDKVNKVENKENTGFSQGVAERIGIIEEEPDDNLVTRAGKGLWNGLFRAANAAGAFIESAYEAPWAAAAGKGLTKAEEARLKELDKKLEIIEYDSWQEQKAPIQERLKSVQDRLEQMGRTSMSLNNTFTDTSERTLLLAQERDLKETLEEIQAAEKSRTSHWFSNYWRGFTQDPLSLLNGLDNIRENEVRNKIETQGYENLSDVEKEYINTRELLREVKNSGLNTSEAYNLGKGVRHSAEFMGEMALGGAASRGVGITGTNVGSRIGRGLGTVATMPGTHNQAFEELNSRSISTINEKGEEIIVVSEAQALGVGDKLDAKLSKINAAIGNIEKNLLENPEDENRGFNRDLLIGLSEEKNLLEQEVNKLRTAATDGTLNRSVADAYGVSGSSQLREVVAEKFMGGAWDNFIRPGIGRTLTRSADAMEVSKPLTWTLAKTEKIRNWGTRASHALDDFQRGTDVGRLTRRLGAHTGSFKMLNSLDGEIAEEIFVQLTPSYGEDYYENFEQLLTPSFYKDVAIQTAILGAKGRALGGAKEFGQHRLAMLNPVKDAKGKTYAQKYKDQKEFLKDLTKEYKKLDKAVTDQEIIEILTSAPNALARREDFIKKIASLEDPNQNTDLTDEQRQIEIANVKDDMMMQLAITAAETGTLDRLEHSLRASSRGNTEADGTFERARGAVDALKKGINKHSGKINAERLINAEIQKYKSEHQLKEIAKVQGYLFKDTVEEFGSGQAFLDQMAHSVGLIEEGGTFDLSSLPTLLEQEDSNAKIAEMRASNLYVNAILNLEVARHLAQEQLDATKETIAYETNPANTEAIKKREQEKLKEAVAKITTAENVDAVKEELVKNAVDDPKTIAKVHAKAIDSTLTNTLEDKDSAEGVKKPSEEMFTAFENFFGEEAKAPAAEEVKLSPREKAVVAASTDELAAPIKVDPNDDAQKTLISNMQVGVKKELETPGLNFSGFIASQRSAFPDWQVEQLYNVSRHAWEQETGEKLSEPEVNRIYNQNFRDLTQNQALASVFGNSNIPQRVTQSPTPAEIKQDAKAGESNVAQYNPVTKVEEPIEYAPHTNRKYAGTGLRLGGVLGINYEEVNTEEERRDLSNTVNDTAKPFMDWRNLRPGTQVEFRFNMDYLLNPNNILSSWKNINADYLTPGSERPERVPTTVRERLTSIFKGTDLDSWEKIEAAIRDYQVNPDSSNPLFQSEEFLKIVPIGTVNDGLTTENQADGTPPPSLLMGGLGDYYWFNNYNVALKVNAKTGEPLIKERALRIEENRKINLEARKAILKDGGLKVTVSEKKDAKNNTRVLKTEQEKKQGYTGNFYSIFSQFGSNLLEFNKNAAIAFLSKSLTFIGSVNNSGKEVIAKIDGKEVTLDRVENWDNFIKDIKKSGWVEGRSVFIHKSGVDSEGQPIYLIHRVINHHDSKQETFKKDRAILNGLYHKLVIHANDTPTQKANKAVLQAEFKKQFGYEFTKGLKEDVFEKLYPSPNTNPNTGVPTGVFRQDFNAKSQTPAGGNRDIIPDFTEFANEAEFLEALKNKVEVPKIHKQEMLLRNLHTNIAFTPITKDGETIYSHHSQPIAMFDFAQASQTPATDVKIAEENRQQLQAQKKELQEQIEQAQTSVEKVSLKRELAIVNRSLVEETAKQAAAQVIAESNNTVSVTSLDGVQYEVAEDSIISYPTEVGEIRYIKDENGDLIRLQRREVTPLSNTEGLETLAVEKILARALSKVNLSNPLAVRDLYKSVTAEFEALVREMRAAGKESEAQFLLDNREAILGEKGKYEDSVKEHIDVLLDISEFEGELDAVTENVKDFESNSYEIDITKSLSFKVKLILSNITDPREGEGFGGLGIEMSLPEVLDALHQILSEANTNSLSEIEKVIEAKVERNPRELSFYKEILAKLKQVEKTNPEILNEVLYNLYQPSVQMRFVMWRANENGFMTLQNFDANVKNPLFVKRAHWRESMKTGGLIELYEGNLYRITDTAYSALEDLHEKVMADFSKDRNIADVNRNQLKALLRKYGITLNEKTLDNIYEGRTQDGLDLQEMLFANAKNSILPVLFQNATHAYNTKDIKLTLDNPDSMQPDARNFDILRVRNSQINDLINADNFVEFIPMGSMYIAGKSIYMYQQPNAITNKVKNLKEALQNLIANNNDDTVAENEKLPGILAEFKDTPITSNSLLLGMLERNPEEAIEYLDTFLISLESLKQSGTPSRDDMEITNLSDKDSFITLLGMFSAGEGKFSDNAFETEYDHKIKLRKGAMSFPTLSDSSQMVFLKTILLDLTEDNINLEDNTLSEEVLDVLKEQLLIADLLRISSYINNVATTGTNIDGYDAGATWITGLPSLNYLQVDGEPYTITKDGQEETVTPKRSLRSMFISFASNPDNNNINSIREFVQTYSADINNDINANINNEVNKLVSPDLKSGQFVDFGLMEKEKLSFEDSGSLNYFKDKSARVVAYDYVVNSFLQQKEIQTLFAGDIAQYFKNKMAGNMKHGLPEVTFQDAVLYYYGSEVEINRIEEITKKGLKEIDASELGPETVAALLEEFPDLKYLDSFLTSNIHPEEAYDKMLPVASAKVRQMFKEVQNNLSKRLKGQISPGSQLVDSKNAAPYYQIMVSDVETASSTILDMIQRRYPNKLKALKPSIERFKILDNKYSKTEEESAEHKKLKKEISKEIPLISAYLETASTDAQEYTSWRENLEQLKKQGRITSSNYNIIKAKLEAQSKDLSEPEGRIKEENRLTQEELRIAMMQPTKPLYSGMVYQNINGHKVQRYMYIKSSSFPLLPEMTEKFPKLNNLRKNVETMESNKETTVRVSYQSANKVGAVKNAVNVSELYSENPDWNVIEDSSVLLPRENFYIQQDKPFKSDKNAMAGKPDRVTRATQFEKIILGDGINKMGAVFPAKEFDSLLLANMGITPNEDGFISGPDLKKIYNSIYEREQKIKADMLFNKLGIDAYSDIAEGNPAVMEKLVNLLNKRITNKQDKKALELLYEVDITDPTTGEITDVKVFTKAELIEQGLTARKAMFRIPLFMTPNSRKFESVLNSVINKNNINLDISGFSSPVASQEGFDYRGYSSEYYQELRKKGLVISSNFNPEEGLKSEWTEDGKLKYAQVFLANKYKVFNPETNRYDYIDLKEYVNEDNVLDTSKIPEELLSMFSFRIPTSSHQSGAIIEVAGFLPHNMADIMVVPKDHTVQIGEDYDIDVRYVYQYNFIRTVDGNLKKLEYSDLQSPDKTLKDLHQDFTKKKQELWDRYYEVKSNVDPNAPLEETNFTVALKNPYWRSNQEKLMEIIFLQDALDHYAEDKLLHAIFRDQYEIDEFSPDFLREKIEELEEQLIPSDVVRSTGGNLRWEYQNFKRELAENNNFDKEELIKAWTEYRNAYTQKADELKALENGLISMYKSVFSSPNNEVRNLITKVLSTDFSEESASMIDEKLSANEEFFNIYSPSTQRKVMKLGADGKMGIGVHSNAVTINSLLQQLDNPLQFIAYTDPDTGEAVPYKIKLGRAIFDGVLGKQVDRSGRRLSEYLMESQNSATDNQKLEIMGRRNENGETINVFSLLQLVGLENEGGVVRGQEVSYASLFISQPIIVEYANLVKKFKSSTDTSFGNPETLAKSAIQEKYTSKIDKGMWATDKDGNPIFGKFNSNALEVLGAQATSENLYGQIAPEGDVSNMDIALQYYIFDTFSRLQKPAKELSKLQRFVNIENGGLGVSYFDVIDLKDTIISLNFLRMTTASKISNPKQDTSLFQEMFGELTEVDSADTELINSLEAEGYIFISQESGQNLYVKPNNHYSHKIMTSISLGYNMWNSLFPYDHRYIKSQIDTIIAASGIAPDSNEAMDLRYDIVSNMKDYSYTNSKRLFGTNIEKYQTELFFDNKANKQESLGAYLLRLKNDPEFKSLFNLPFFKDLQIAIGEETHPTIIKYNTGDVSPLANMRTYNRLSRLVNSTKELPAKMDGTPMTEEKLMKELLMYSLLADQGNGAIGFRQHLPMSLFEKYQVDKMLRQRNEISGEMTNFLYNGPQKSIETFLGSSIADNGVIPNFAGRDVDEVNSFVIQLNAFIRGETGESDVYLVTDSGDVINTRFDNPTSHSNFVRQYFQHNPDKIRPIKYSESEQSAFSKLLKNAGVSHKAFNEGKLTRFNAKNNSRDFIVLQSANGTPLLYEKVAEKFSPTGEATSTYQRIPVLGTFGFKEYNTSRKVSHSKVQANNVAQNWLTVPVDLEITRKYINDRSLQEIVDDLFVNVEGPYTPLLELLKDFLPDLNRVEIKTTASLKGRAVYRRGKDGNPPTILLSEDVINKGMSVRELQDTIIEEVLHHVTTSAVDPFVHNIMGSINTDGTFRVQYTPRSEGQVLPAPLQSLLRLYKQAGDHYIAKFGLDAFKNKFEGYQNTAQVGGENSLTTSGDIEGAAYRMSNFHEFMAGIFLKDEEFALEMANTPYLKSGKSFLRKFVETLANLLNRVLPEGARKDSISARTIESLMKFLEENHGRPEAEGTIAPKKPVLPTNTAEQIAKVEALTGGVIENPAAAETTQNFYRGVPVIDTTDIINAEGQKGAASYSRTENVIKVNRPFLQQKFQEKAWTNPRNLIEIIHGEKVNSKAKPLPENQFQTYEQFETFVMEHEFQHSVYSRQDFDAGFPGKTKGDYETEINERALFALEMQGVLETPTEDSKYTPLSDLFSPISIITQPNNVSLSEPITNVNLRC